MRAYMSKMAYRSEVEPTALPGQHISLAARLQARKDAAVREARAILAVTEPTTWRPSRNEYVIHDEMTAALADALATFVAERS